MAAACAALEIEPFYSELVLHRRRLETVGRSLAETRRSLPETETALQQAARLESESETAWRQTEQCRDVGLKTIAEVERLDVVLAETDRTVASLEQKIAEHAAEQSSRLEQIGGLEGELATLLSGQTVADLEAAIRKRETATESKRDGRDFAEIIGLRDESAKQLRLWELLRESLEGREQTETEITEWGKRQARLERDREALQSEEKELAGKKERAAETLERLEERLEWLGRIASLEEQRRRLEDGKPCPLCGALEHPYASQAEPAPDETANERDAAKRLLHEIEKAIGGTGVRRAILEQELRRMQRDTETAAKRLDERNRRIAETVAELGLSETPRIDEITARREEIDRQREQLSQTLIDLERMRAETERFRQCLQDAQKIVSQIETRRILVASREKELESAQGELAERTAGREKTLEERQRLFGDKEIDPEKKRLEEQLQTARETWTGRRESCREAAVRLNNLRQRLESETRAEQEAGQTVRAASDDFDKRLQAAEFASESEFVAARLEPDRRKALEEAEQRRNDRLRELRTLREENAAALNALRAESPKRCPSRESLVSVRESRQARLGELGERIGELRQRLENVRDLDERRKSLADERKKALATGRLWGTLHRLIGSADGKKYRAFAQALTFRILIDEANRQLEKMTGRYLLIPNDDSDKALDLSVLDADQGGAVRSTKNLSGGECFLVSLALALGLSSMSGSRTRVDSLFLDEGFGTLDEQTLETALSVLERLRSDEKQIGVISHVPAIRDRIAVQIRVKPKKRGQSVVEIVTGS